MGEATVDLAAIGSNTALVRDSARVDVMAVVKADAFGHGMGPVARTPVAHGAGWLGVTSGNEAPPLRAAGARTPLVGLLHRAGEGLHPPIPARLGPSLAAARPPATVWSGRASPCTAWSPSPVVRTAYDRR